MLRILNSSSKIFEAFDSCPIYTRSSIVAMYSSAINGIIADKSLMSIPIDDHLVHRGHCVYGLVNIINGKAYRLTESVQKILKAAERINIQLPMTNEDICKVLLDLAAFTQMQNVQIKYWVSSGRGNMMIVPIKDLSTFYAVAQKHEIKDTICPVSEFTLSLPITKRFHNLYRNSKYLVNILCSMNSKNQGGCRGLLVDENNNFIESENTICIVTHDRKFVTPNFEVDTCQTPIDRVVKFAEDLCRQEIINQIEIRELSVEEAVNASEAMIIERDYVLEVLALNGSQITTTEGRVTKAIKEALVKDFTNDELTVGVDYNSYDKEL
ncbi:hypothetical protein SteCoe_26704 [Stentor coeruleus]|uniref:Uncharacterized protein n=1 Tax=Stentor coeruleus TaxID=5963 RepID=A0A1R2BC75_9CILI|nr:hypothetical protein SteCoe_26704 [Stentor coeruleus]